VPDTKTAHLRNALEGTAMEGKAMSTAVISSSAFGTRFAGEHRRTGTSRLRITRRGYAFLTLVVAMPLVIAALGIALNGGGAAATDQAASVSFSHVTVRAGQSLWHLAAEIAPTADPRDVVSDIVHLNRLASAVVQPGQSIAIPLKYSR
jgi:LysM repeat protein